MLVKGNPTLAEKKGGILLIQLGDIGDVVLTMPTLRALRQHFPDRELMVCVREQAEELVADSPWTDETLLVKKGEMDIRSWIAYQKNILRALVTKTFFLAIDLRTGTRGGILALLSSAPYRIGRFAEPAASWRNRIFTHLVKPENERVQYSTEHNLNIVAPFGIETADTLPHLTVTELRSRRAHQLLVETGAPSNRPLIGIHPFSLWAYKEWRMDRLIALIDGIKARYDVSVIITGAPEEAVRAEEIRQECRSNVISLAGKTTVGDLPALLERCDLFIGVDTAALHIAAAVGVPTLGIFGPSDPVNWAPRGECHRVIGQRLPCRPCRQKGCQNSEFSRCLDELDSETVLRVAQEMLQKIGVYPTPTPH